MKKISQLTHWKICRFWNNHKWLHRCAIIFILAPACLLMAIPAAVIAAYDSVVYDIEWLGELWKRSSHPYEQWIKAAESGEED